LSEPIKVPPKPISDQVEFSNALPDRYEPREPRNDSVFDYWDGPSDDFDDLGGSEFGFLD
jgi:hypothetical protein